MSLYDLYREPALEDPVLLVCLDGWIDAGLAAITALRQVVEACDEPPQVIGDFDTEELIDYRSRRPVMHLVDGVNTTLSWPVIQLQTGTIDGHDLLILTGAEPDHRWKEFASSVADIAVNFGCRVMTGFGAYPAPAPHTRPAQVVTTSSSPTVAANIGFTPGRIDVAAGVMAAIEHECASRGILSVGLWGQVPHYAANMAYPEASLALLRSFEALTGVAVATGQLPAAANDTRARIDSLVANSGDHQAMVHELERQNDEARQEVIAAEAMASSDALVSEIERFLRQQPPS